MTPETPAPADTAGDARTVRAATPSAHPAQAAAPNPASRTVVTPKPPARAASAATTANAAHGRPGEVAEDRTVTPTHWAVLGAIVVLGLALRLREPLSSPLIGAEDPYNHMENTWDLIQGKAVLENPLGMKILLFPFALMGPAVFYEVARFLPALIGAGMVATVFLLCRRYTHPAGALMAALVVAAVPEMIRRTTLLFPEGIDLMLIPVLFLLTLRATEPGVAWKPKAYAMGAIVLLFLLVHPWVMGLLLPPLLIFWLSTVWSMDKALRLPVAGGIVVVAAVSLFALRSGEVSVGVVSNALPRLGDILSHPASLAHPPRFVDLPDMLTVAGLVLGLIGVVAAFKRRDRFSMLALLWTLLLLPLILVDWFDVWYLPHRTVAYFAIGVAMLGAVAVSELMRMLPGSSAKSLSRIGYGALAIVAVLTVPAGASMEGWYRLYDDEKDQPLEAWAAIDELNPSLVVTGSWQARMNYRAVTGNDALFNPLFFEHASDRDAMLTANPDLVVVIDKFAREQNVDTSFLADWERIGSWGQGDAIVAYRQG